MRFLWNLSLLVAFLCFNVLSEEIALAQGLVRRQIFSSLPSVCTGKACPETTSTSTKSSSSSTTISTTSSSSASITSSSSFPSSTISTVSSTSSATSSVSYNQYAVTTTFTQPPSCTGGFTAIEDWGTDIYDNLIYSQSGFDLEYMTCFPPQFYNSVLASIASTTLGPFTALICPFTWESYDLNSTYVICCPSGYSLLAPNWDNPIRPGAGAVCTSSIGGSALLDITSFDSTGGETVVPATAGSNGTYVWGYAFDGITTSVSNTPTSSSGSQSIASSTSLSSLITTTLSTSSSSLRPSTTSSSTATSISVRTTTTTSISSLCTGIPAGIALASPAPSGALCNVQANSLALAGTGLLIAYTSGSPYIASVLACAAECKATSTCTNFYFIAGSACNLHYGANSCVLNTSGVNAFTFYDISCFTTCAIM